MPAAEKGRFCQSCRKTVYDFTKLSDRSIIEKIQLDNTVCGRFTNDQLDRELIVPKAKSAVWAASLTGIFSLFTGANMLHAQVKAQTVQTDQQAATETLGKVISSQNIIYGKVTEGDLPVPAVMVQVKGANTTTQTDMDGRFAIAAKENDILVFSFSGMKTEEVRVSGSKNIELVMHNDNQMMGEVVVVKRRTFFGRISYSVGSWFR